MGGQQGGGGGTDLAKERLARGAAQRVTRYVMPTHHCTQSHAPAQEDPAMLPLVPPTRHTHATHTHATHTHATPRSTNPPTDRTHPTPPTQAPSPCASSLQAALPPTDPAAPHCRSPAWRLASRTASPAQPAPAPPQTPARKGGTGSRGRRDGGRMRRAGRQGKGQAAKFGFTVVY